MPLKFRPTRFFDGPGGREPPEESEGPSADDVFLHILCCRPGRPIYGPEALLRNIGYYVGRDNLWGL